MANKPGDPKAADRLAQIAGHGAPQAEAARAVGVQAPAFSRQAGLVLPVAVPAEDDMRR
jgi:hypothetical protein